MTNPPLQRIAHLLAMAGDVSSPKEAAIAAAKAQELMDQHRLTHEDVLGPKDEIKDHRDEPIVNAKRVELWLIGLANVVAQHNGCFTVLVRDQATGKKALTLIGRQEDVDVVRYVFGYLRREIERVTAAKRRTGAFRERPGSKTRFRIGCVVAVSIELDKARRRATQNAPSQAIVKMHRDYKDAERWAFKNVPGLHMNDEDVHVAEDDRAFQDGYREGAKIRIRPGMEDDEVKGQLT